MTGGRKACIRTVITFITTQVGPDTRAVGRVGASTGKVRTRTPVEGSTWASSWTINDTARVPTPVSHLSLYLSLSISLSRTATQNVPAFLSVCTRRFCSSERRLMSVYLSFPPSLPLSRCISLSLSLSVSLSLSLSQIRTGMYTKASFGLDAERAVANTSTRKANATRCVCVCFRV